MSQDLLALLHTGQRTSKFDSTSRYFSTEVAVLELTPGAPVAYLRRRFLPDPAGMTIAHRHRVQQGERLDLIADSVIGDALQWWKLADANRILRATELEEVSTTFDIALAEGS